jgi:hypothetical protein
MSLFPHSLQFSLLSNVNDKKDEKEHKIKNSFRKSKNDSSVPLVTLTSDTLSLVLR